jgi:predicted lipid-binding transport protein (Tim44 family)
MRRTVAVTALLVMALAPFLWTVDAWARAGGGGSSGSRGSRSYSSPARPAPSLTPSQPASPSPSIQQPMPQHSGWGGLGGMLGGLLVGGLIGSLLFGGGWGGGFGGIGLLEIVMVGGLIWLAMSYMRRRPAASPYAGAGDYGRSASQRPARDGLEYAAATTTIDAPVAPSDATAASATSVRWIPATIQCASPKRLPTSSSRSRPRGWRATWVGYPRS